MNKAQKLTRYLLLLLVLLTLNSYAQQMQNAGYVINGHIKGVDSGIIRMLSRDLDGASDSAFIVNGKFLMKGRAGIPERRRFIISPGNWGFNAFVIDTTLKYSIDTSGAEHYDSGGDHWVNIWAIDESGSELPNIYTNYQKETGFKDLVQIIVSLRNKLGAVKANKDEASKVRQELDSIGHLIFARQKAWIENFSSKHPSSVAGAFLFYDYYQSCPDGAISLSYLDSTLERFSGPAISSSYYQKLVDISIKLKQLQPNSLAPDFTLLKEDRTKYTLSSSRGNYTLIDFWASWCIPCRKAIPAWKEVYAQYKDKGLTIVSVSDDRNREDWIKALRKEQMPWVQVIDEFPNKGKPALVGTLYGGHAMPFYVFLDKEGKVIIASDYEEVVQKKIEEVIQ